MRQAVTVFLICNYGFWKELRPVEPFLTPYLVSDYKNFTDVQLYSQVYPYWTYSYLVILIPVFILTDLLRKKPVLLCESIAYIVTWVLLIWGKTLLAMQFMQVSYGVATATEVAYYSYIYAVLDEKHFKIATSLVRGSVLFGRCFAYGLGQILISTGAVDYMTLNYISLPCLGLVFLISLTLPMPKRVVPITSRDDDVNITEETQPNSDHNLYSAYFRDLKNKFFRCYRQGFIVKWSLWWALGTCGFFQIGNYIQNLWETMQDNNETVHNGITEAVNTFLGAIVAMGLQLFHINWKISGELILGMIALVDAGLLFFLSQTKTLVVAYVLYVIFCVLYQLLITIATYNVARYLEPASHGLVFGCNTFVALFLQTILTFAVADKNGFNIEIRNQFLIYASYHGVIGVIFIVMGFVTVKNVGVRRCFWLLCEEDTKQSVALRQETGDESLDDNNSINGAELFTTQN